MIDLLEISGRLSKIREDSIKEDNLTNVEIEVSIFVFK